MRAPLARVFKDKTEAAIFFTAFLVEIAFGLYFVWRWGFTFCYGDSITHVYMAGTAVNNGAQSNLANVGTVWLPLFRIFLIPLVLIEPLYRTGFAGTIVNALATGGICVILYRLIGGGRLGIFASLLFLANAFTLVLGATPMMEQTALFFMILATYYFKHYWEKDDLIAFMKCSLALLFGTLTRYEVWAVALLVASLFFIKESRGKPFYRLAYIHFPFWGVFAWLFWNLAIFRDPLMFLHHPWAGAKQVGVTSYLGNAFLVANLTFVNLYEVSGCLSLVSIVALIILVGQKRWDVVLPAILLLSPIVFESYALYAGQSKGDIRYFLLALPGLVVTPLFLIRVSPRLGNPKLTAKNARLLSIIFLILTSLLYGVSLQTHINIISKGDYTSLEGLTNLIIQLQLIKNIIGNESILLPSAQQNFQALLVLGIKPLQIIDDFDGQLYLEATVKPWDYCSFVIMPKASPNSSVIREYNDFYRNGYYVYLYYNDNAWRSEFLARFKLVLETPSCLVYQRVV